MAWTCCCRGSNSCSGATTDHGLGARIRPVAGSRKGGIGEVYRPGDTGLDRISQAFGLAFVSLGDGIDCTTPAGRLHLHVLAALAEFERARIAERVRAGLARASTASSTS